MNNESQDLQKNIEEAKQMIARLNAQVAEQEAKLKVQSPPPPPPPAPPAPPQAVPLPAQPLPQVPTMRSSFEEQLAGKWFVWIGGLALFIGMTLLIKYALDNQWIGPWAVIVIGLLMGLGLMVWGNLSIPKYRTFGQIVSGLGVGMLYLTLWGAYGFYALIPSIVAFILMAFVTAVGLFLSVHHNALLLFVVSMLGGFLTPLMVSSGENKQLELFSYIALLDLAILGISFFKKWLWANLVGLLGTALIFSGWYESFYTRDQLAPTMFFLTLFFLIYSASSVVYTLMKREKSSGIEQVLTVFSAVVYFPSAYGLLDPQYHQYMGGFAIVLALYYFLWAYLIRKIVPEDSGLYSFMAYLGAGFLALAIPIQFDGLTVTIGWALLSAVLLLLGLQVRYPGIVFLGMLMFILSGIKLLTVDLFSEDVSGSFIINRMFGAFSFLVAIAYGLAAAVRWLMKGEKIGSFTPNGLEGFLLFGGSFFLTVGISRDVLEFYPDDSAMMLALLWLGETLIFLAWGSLQRKNAVLAAGMVMLILSILRLLGLNEAVYIEDRTLFFNQVFATFGFGVLVAYVSAFLFRMVLPEEGLWSTRRRGWVATFLFIANMLTIFAVTQEISAYYDSRISAIRSTEARNKSGDFRYGRAVSPEIKKMENQKSTAHSVFWIFYAVILVAFGIIRKSKTARISGLLLLLVSILKLFFYDLWDLGRLYQIISSITLGLVLIGTSYAYLRYKDKIKEIV